LVGNDIVGSTRKKKPATRKRPLPKASATTASAAKASDEWRPVKRPKHEEMSFQQHPQFQFQPHESMSDPSSFSARYSLQQQHHLQHHQQQQPLGQHPQQPAPPMLHHQHQQHQHQHQHQHHQQKYNSQVINWPQGPPQQHPESPFQQFHFGSRMFSGIVFFFFE
jgi:hypothetical protein